MVIDSHDGHNSPHSETSYGIIDGGGPTVAGEEEGDSEGDKEQTLSASHDIRRAASCAQPSRQT